MRGRRGSGGVTSNTTQTIPFTGVIVSYCESDRQQVVATYPGCGNVSHNCFI